MERLHKTRTPSLSEEAVLDYLRRLAEEELELTEEQIRRIGPDTPIVEGLHLDSVSQVVLLANIEEAYGFLFEFEDRERIQTVRDLVEMILHKAGQGEDECN